MWNVLISNQKCGCWHLSGMLTRFFVLCYTIIRFTRIKLLKWLPKTMCLLNHVPHVPSQLTLRALHVFMPSCLHAFAPWMLSCLSLFRALPALLTPTLFIHVKIVLGCICSPAKTFHFPRTIKAFTNCTDFKWVKKKAVKPFKWEKFLSIFKTWN